MGVINWSAAGGIICDLVLISILLSSTALGYRKGLVGVLYKIIAFVVSLIIVFVLYKAVAQIIIDNTQLDEKLAVAIETKLSGAKIDDAGNIIADRDSNIPINVINFVNSLVKDTVETKKAEAVTYISNELSIFMVRTGTMIVLFIVSNVLLWFLRSVLEVIANLPIISLFNKSGGIIYGVIKGFLIIYLILAIASLLSPLFSNGAILRAINQSYFGSRMYNNNILLNFVLKK